MRKRRGAQQKRLAATAHACFIGCLLARVFASMRCKQLYQANSSHQRTLADAPHLRRAVLELLDRCVALFDGGLELALLVLRRAWFGTSAVLNRKWLGNTRVAGNRMGSPGGGTAGLGSPTADTGGQRDGRWPCPASPSGTGCGSPAPAPSGPAQPAKGVRQVEVL